MSSCLSVENQFGADDLVGSGCDVVHPADPGHLILHLQMLGDTFGLHHLLDDKFMPFTCLLV